MTRSTSPTLISRPMSSGQVSVSTVSIDEPTPTRKRPFQLPPINPYAPPQHGSKAASPTSVSNTRSKLHSLLNHSDSQRHSSLSPASSHGPATPGTGLPPINTLTTPRAMYPIGSADPRKTQSFNAAVLPTLPGPSQLVGLNLRNEGRRDSNASFVTASSPSTSFTMRASPPSDMSAMYSSQTGWTLGGVPITLDTQQGSKIADEKRKRNAGASARFRQRRKEKEKEANFTIQKHENKIKELEAQVGWYRNERDHYRQLCISHGLGGQIGPRPASPKPTQMTPNASTATTPAEWQQNGERGSDEGRNQRRRIDYFDGAHQASSYSRQVFGQTPPSPLTPRTSSESLRQLERQQAVMAR